MVKSQVVIIDFGVGNLLSVQRAVEHLGAEGVCTSNAELIRNAERVILPGVGAFANAMHSLESLGLIGVVREVTARGTPLLGICLGMQLLLDESEEFGLTKGLGLIPGRVTAIPDRSLDGQVLKIPHIGWNELVLSEGCRWKDTLLEDSNPGDAMYFVHSFMAVPDSPSMLLANCAYGGHLIPAVIRSENVMGCQFHPEKSGKLGLLILNRFVNLRVS
jgi:glutamine amidotransferase